MMESAGVDGFSCAFTAPRSCTHETLFQEAYERSNRMNRTKIVRCFPHCCPGHKTRSYCGTSLLLKVHTPTVDTISPIQVFARFRPVLRDAARVGELMPMEAISSSLQSEESPTAEWIASQTIATRMGPGGIIFEINAMARWVYAWDSGATKAQRLTKHVLEAVVVTPYDRHGQTFFRVVAKALSPSFTFASFRRAADRETKEPQQSLLFQALVWEMERRRNQTTKSSRATTSIFLPEALSLGKQLEKASLSEMQDEVNEKSFAEILALILNAVDELPANRLRTELCSWESSQMETILNSVQLGKNTAHQQPVDGVEMAALLACWLHSDPRICAEAEAFAARGVVVILDNHAMRQLYKRWMDRVSKRVLAFLDGYQWTWTELIASVSDGKAIGESVTCRHAFDWASFVARVQRSAVERYRRQRDLCGWKRGVVWVCRSEDVRVMVRNNCIGLVGAVSTGLFINFVNQLSAIHLNLQSRRLRVESASRKIGSTGMDLILDGKERQFAFLPNGDSSLGAFASNSHTIGDYFGFTSGFDFKSASAEVTCFAWPREQGGKAYRWRWAVVSTGTSLDVSVHVDAGHVKTHDDPIDTLRVHEKLKLVLRWVTQCTAVLPYRLAAE